jgi:hypothetical protein
MVLGLPLLVVLLCRCLLLQGYWVMLLLVVMVVRQREVQVVLVCFRRGEVVLVVEVASLVP